MEIVLALIHQAMEKYPQIAAALVVIGALRVVLKPLMTMLHAYADYTSDPKDNAMLAKAEASAWYKGLMYVLDYLASVKLK